MGMQAAGGWPAVDQAFGDLPQSTEQVLHPDVYARGEDPVAVDLPDDLAQTLGAGWSRRRSRTRSASTRLDLARSAGRRGRDRRGRRLGRRPPRVLSGPDGAWAIAWRTTWDSAADADRVRDRRRDGGHQGGRPGRRAAGHRRDDPLGRHRQRRRRRSARWPTPSAWPASEARPAYIDSGAEIPSSPSVLASVIWVARARASRAADRSGSSGSTTRASR